MAFTDQDVSATTRTPLLQQKKFERVAVFRALQLGDMLCAVPALRALRRAMPGAKITLVGLPWAEQFASRFHQYVDDFVAFPGHPALPEQPVREDQVASFHQAMKSRQLDLVVQMHGSGEISNQIVAAFGAREVAGCVSADAGADPVRFLAYPTTGTEPERLLQLTEFLGAPALGAHLEFPLTQQDEEELAASGVASGLEPGSYICIHPGARFRDKCWAPQRFAEVADRLAAEFGVDVVLTGSAKEADLTAAVAASMTHRAIDAASPISIGAMAALMSRARLLVCNDTGVSHIAAGLKLPSVVVFSKADIQRWSPLDSTRHRCIWDPEGRQAAAVLEYGRILLREQAVIPAR